MHRCTSQGELGAAVPLEKNWSVCESAGTAKARVIHVDEFTWSTCDFLSRKICPELVEAIFSNAL